MPRTEPTTTRAEEARNYFTFLRSCRNWQEFASAEKFTVDTELTYSEAREACQQYNANLTDAEIEAGTKMEFTHED